MSTTVGRPGAARQGRDVSGTAVSCRGVGVRLGGVPVVRGVDLDVRAGSWLTLVGPNGAGKTSLLYAVAGLVRASGQVSVCGHDPATTGRRTMSRLVAMMPQRPVVPEGITVHDLVGLGRTPYLRPFGTGSSADRAAVRQTMQRLGLTDLADRPATELSGGELQRVVLARAVTQQPRVLLLDEPTSALDLGHQQSVLELVDELRQHDGLTVIAAMHDLTLAGQYGSRVLLLDRGQVAADSTPADVLQADRLQRVYGASVEVLARPGGPAVLPLRRGLDTRPVQGPER